MGTTDLVGADPASGVHDEPSAPDEHPPPGPDQTGAQPEILLEHYFDEDNLYRVRAAVAAHVATVADGRTVDVVVLIAHELASNAARHGGGSGRLRLWPADDALHCEVSDGGSGLADPAGAGHSLPPPALPGGRGLWIARQLSELHIVASTEGTTITAVVPL